MTPDDDIQTQIEALEQERSELRSREGENDPTLEQDRIRLDELEVEIERLYDLKRQRRALRNAGEDPDGASERDAGTVKGYEQ